MGFSLLPFTCDFLGNLMPLNRILIAFHSLSNSSVSPYKTDNLSQFSLYLILFFLPYGTIPLKSGSYENFYDAFCL